jgi:hypothetical protein
METPAHGLLRWVRSAAVAVATIGLAATAHGVGGGAVPGWAPLTVLTLVTVLACVVLTGRRRGTAFLAAAMTVLQVALHEGFLVLAPMGCGAPADMPIGHAAMHEAVPGALMSCVATGSAVSTSHLTAQMFAAHTLATVLLAAALARGERALWHLRRLVSPPLPRAVPAAMGLTTETVLPARVVVLTAWTSVSSLVRRGPPTAPAGIPC